MKQTIPDIISAPFPFPALSWWRTVVPIGKVCFDLGERFRKMSGKNRYYLAGPQGKQGLSIPLKGGRQQKCAMREVAIFYDDDWQRRHWKTITSLYRKAPFFEFFAPDLQELYQQKVEKLYQWNLRSVALIIKLLELDITIETTDHYHADYPNEVQDLRKEATGAPCRRQEATVYHQVFESRVGFQPDCSILDLLFCEGIYARLLLKR